MILVLSALLAVQSLFASPNFTALRYDQSVPEACQDMDLSFFSFPMERIFVGRQGALKMGFTDEYPVTRSNASLLWKYFKSLTHGKENQGLLQKIQSDKDLRRDYKIILKNYKYKDFYFQNEGEILELLAIEQLYQKFPENSYYITGGYEYHEKFSHKTIGELDIFVGNRHDCSAVAIGEAKLGTRKMLHKAYEQLERFENFLIRNNVGQRPKAATAIPAHPKAS